MVLAIPPLFALANHLTRNHRTSLTGPSTLSRYAQAYCSDGTVERGLDVVQAGHVGSRELQYRNWVDVDFALTDGGRGMKADTLKWERCSLSALHPTFSATQP
jgi:hypothetical protein